MRLPQIDHTTLTEDRAALYQDMRAGIEAHFTGFTAIDDRGDLVGPWNPWLAFPQFGGPVWNLVKAMVANSTLPKAVREVAILVTGAHFRSAYELYAHILVAEQRGLSDAKIRTITAGARPSDLTDDEGLAYDFALELVTGGVTPELIYREMVTRFGANGAAEFIYLVGLYCAVSITLNGFSVPLPSARLPYAVSDPEPFSVPNPASVVL